MEKASAAAPSQMPTHRLPSGQPQASAAATSAVAPIATPPQPGTAVNGVARSMVWRMNERSSMARSWRAGTGRLSGRRGVTDAM